MEARETLTLSKEQINKILFLLYFKDSDSEMNELKFEDIDFKYEIKNPKKGMNLDFILERKKIVFILGYKELVEELEEYVRKEIIVSLEDFNEIIQKEFLNDEYQIEEFEEHLFTDKNSIEPSTIRDFKYIKYNLKKKEKVKTKKKGWR